MELWRKRAMEECDHKQCASYCLTVMRECGKLRREARASATVKG